MVQTALVVGNTIFLTETHSWVPDEIESDHAVPLACSTIAAPSLSIRV